MIDPTKDSFTQPLTIKYILYKIQILVDDYCRTLPILKDKDLGLNLKKQPISCFFNNYVDVDLKAWQANMDFKPVF